MTAIQIKNEPMKWANEREGLGMELEFSDELKKFLLWFNGVIVSSSQTISSPKRKAKSLIEKHSLTEL